MLRIYQFAIILVGLLSVAGTAAIALTPEHSATVQSTSNPTLIRMHVRADSDHPSDQCLKEKVRDDLLEALATTQLVRPDLTLAEAVTLLKGYLPILEGIARNRLETEGASLDVEVELGVFEYDERTYRGQAFPAGRYLAVEVRIGSGAGRNFWCILFPAMCFVPEEVQELAQQRARGNIAEAAPLTDAGAEGYNADSRLLVPRVSWLWLQSLYEPDPHYTRLFAAPDELGL